MAIVGGCGSYRETGRQNHEERDIVSSEERLDLDVVDDEINFLETRHPPRRLPEYSSLKAVLGRQAAKAQTGLPVADREQPAPHTSARQSLGLSYPLQHHLHARFYRRRILAFYLIKTPARISAFERLPRLSRCAPLNPARGLFNWGVPIETRFLSLDP